MLQIQLLRENPQEVIDRLKIKNFDATDLVAEIRELDSENRNLKKRIDDNLMAQNQGAKKIGQLFKEGKRDEAEAIKAEMATLKESERTDRAKLQEQEELLLNKMVLLPNLPNAAVKPGKGAEDNEIVYTQGDASRPHRLLPRRGHSRRFRGNPAALYGERGFRLRHRPTA